MARAITKATNIQKQRRLADGAAQLYVSTEDSFAVAKAAIDDYLETADARVLIALQEDLIRQFQARDAELARDITGSYTASRAEAAFRTDNLAGYPVDTFQNVRMGNRAAFNGVHNPLADAGETAMRQQRQAAQIIRIIQDGERRGLTRRQIEVEVGKFMGIYSPQNKRRIVSRRAFRTGQLVPTNGIVAERYRVLRTEMHRVNATADVDNMNQALQEGVEMRLRKGAVLDERTRDQSRAMEGQISDEQGRFLYPDGRRYHMGDQPPQWSINDRGFEEEVIINTTGEADQARAEYRATGGPTKWRTLREWADFNEIDISAIETNPFE